MSALRLLTRVALGVAAAAFGLAVYSWVMAPDVRPLRTSNPDSTAFMRLRAAEAAVARQTSRMVWRWASYGRIAESLKEAVVAAEDGAFWGHDGVDAHELRAALEDSLRQGTPPRGASTITQQLAKNLYLSPSRNPYRKLVELVIARRLEAELSKARILELYLNVVEWGDGIWGAEAAARAYFRKNAAGLSDAESALLAAALINPRVYVPARPDARLRARQRIVLERMEARRAARSR